MQQRFFTIVSHTKKPQAPLSMNVVMALIAINGLVFLLVPRTNSWQFALSAYGIRQLRFWQLVSYMFLHGNWLHLLLNMWGLYLFGTHVYQRLGTKRFLTLYVLSGISGSLFWLLFNWSSRSSVIGASGAVFGVVMAAAVLSPDMRIMLVFPPVPMKLRTLVFVFAGIEIFSELSNVQGGVAHLAHLGGFLGAYIYMRTLGGDRLLDIAKSPLKGIKGIGIGHAAPKQSEVNRQTFEDIMAEIEEIEREKKQK